MVRPHIEFLHAQDLPWETSRLPEPLGVLDCKVLSMDDQTGACSIILRYPAGWVRSQTEHLGSAHEFLVLEGELEINGQAYGLDCYGYLPAGLKRYSTSSERGAVVLTFFDNAPEIYSGRGNMVENPDATAVLYRNLHDMEWSTEGIDPDIIRGRYIAHKRLRHNPETGDTTFVLEGSAHFHPEGWKEWELHHPCVEEMFLLSGDLSGPQGIMRTGAYFWRPPGIWRGPFASRLGYIGVFRFLGGHHVNIWGEKQTEVSLTPKHNPVLPDDLKSIATNPRPANTPY